MSDNLNGKQFPKRIYGTDENPPKYTQRLKSPWIPNQSTIKRGYGMHTDLERHIMRHHTKSYYEEGGRTEKDGSPMWTKTLRVPQGMTDTEYHDQLHEEGHFEWGQEHKHFEPKGKK